MPTCRKLTPNRLKPLRRLSRSPSSRPLPPRNRSFRRFRRASLPPIAAKRIGASSIAPRLTKKTTKNNDEHRHEPDEHPEHAELHAAAGNADLSEDEATTLAEQLAEARHEEASAEAEADEHLGILDEEQPTAPETAAEVEEFVAETEAQERIEQLGQDEEERVDQLALEAAEAMGPFAPGIRDRDRAPRPGRSIGPSRFLNLTRSPARCSAPHPARNP